MINHYQKKFLRVGTNSFMSYEFPTCLYLEVIQLMELLMWKNVKKNMYNTGRYCVS